MTKRIQKLFFETIYMIIVVDQQKLRINISTVSLRLMRATPKEREAFRISPTGNTVTWPKLNIELPLTCLLQMASRYWC